MLPPATFLTSSLQQQITVLLVKHLVLANDLVRDFLQLRPENTFIKPTEAEEV